jgi:methyl-accepting chemotaxis protein
MAVGQMDQVTQQNAALVEEAAAASESMQQQAAQLAEVVSVFQLGTEQPNAGSASNGRGGRTTVRTPAGHGNTLSLAGIGG